MDIKKFSFKLSNIKGPAGALTKNLGWLFFIFFLLLVVFEILEINTSLQIFLQLAHQPQPQASNEKGVRINFDNYNAVVQRIENGQNFVPSDNLDKDPFSATH